MLPGEAGIRLYQRLRTNHRLCLIPVVMLSTLDSSTYYRCPGAKRSPTGQPIPEPEAYLQKPPEADELLAAANRGVRVRVLIDDSMSPVKDKSILK